jgi:hypothetical protein
MKMPYRSVSSTSFRGATLVSMMRVGAALWLIGVVGPTSGCSSSGGTKPANDAASGTGVGGAGGGSGSTCGKNVTTGCTATSTTTAPSNGIIADFSGADGGIEIMGGLTTYGGIAQPTYTVNTGSIDVMEASGTSLNGPQYAGLVLFFNNCVNACAFQGVSFSIKGSMTGCTMQFSSNFTADVCNDGTTGTDPKGSYRYDAGASCPAYSPQLPVTGITSTAQTVKVAFNDANLVGGVPETAVDNGHLTAVQWQFTIPMAGDGGGDACIANINISDVKFY